MLRGPQFGSPPRPCELDVRNDQLEAAVPLPGKTVRRLASGGASVTIPVGTHHPTPRKSYTPTRLCSQFPHIYAVVEVDDPVEGPGQRAERERTRSPGTAAWSSGCA